MKITMYELLGMAKNGKAPKKVLYNEYIYSYVERNRFFAKYIREPFDAKIPNYLFTDITNMNDEVEILEEKKIPETLDELNGFIEFNKSGHWILKGVVTHERLESMKYEVK